MDDLNDDSRKVAEDIINQPRLGFREEAINRIVFILDSLHRIQEEFVKLKNREEEEELSAAKDRILIFLRTKLRRVGYERLRRNFNDTSYTDAFLKKLLKKYPKQLKSCIFKGGKPGITLAPDELQKLKVLKK